jgi:transposase
VLTQFVQQADQKLAGYLQALETGDADEDQANTGGSGPGHKDPRLAEKIAAVRGKRGRHQALLAELDRSGEDQISLTDPDSRAMTRMAKVGVGYNVQVAVDTKHKLIAEQEVHSQVVDMGLLATTAKAAMEALGVERIEAVADRGTFKIEDVEACEAAGITPYVPKPVRGSSVREGYFGKDQLRYDPTTDTFTCPGGQIVRPCRRGRSRDNVKVDTSNREACRACPLRPRCTKSYRHVSRLENEAVLDRMAARLAARPEVLDQRRTCVEHPFGTIKQRMLQGAFLMRRLENVRGEFSLTALACHIQRASSLVRVPGLIAAARA